MRFIPSRREAPALAETYRQKARAALERWVASLFDSHEITRGLYGEPMPRTDSLTIEQIRRGLDSGDFTVYGVRGDIARLLFEHGYAARAEEEQGKRDRLIQSLLSLVRRN